MLIFGITQRSSNRKRLDVQHRSKDQWCMNDRFIGENHFFKLSVHLSVRKSGEKLQTNIWKI